MPITRRSFLYGAAALQTRRTRPNILLLLADNWAWPHASAYRDPLIRTPIFDRLAKEGVVFTHSFAPNPSCSPSRSLLLSGQETHRLGRSASLYGELAPHVPTYTGLLEKSGYLVGFSDKGWGSGSPEKAGWPHNHDGSPCHLVFLGTQAAHCSSSCADDNILVAPAVLFSCGLFSRQSPCEISSKRRTSITSPRKAWLIK